MASNTVKGPDATLAESSCCSYDPGTLSNIPGREDGVRLPLLVCVDTPLIFPNQLRLPAFAAWPAIERGLFVTSAIPAAP